MKQAHHARMIVFNPCTAARPPKRKKKEIPVLSRDELQILLNALEGSRLYDIAFLAACTGMRRSEHLGLRWSDVDLEYKSLVITQTLEETREHGMRIEATKTKSSQRRITLPAAAVLALQSWRRQQDEEHLKLGLGRDDKRLVFTRQDGDWYSPRSISHAFTRAVAKIDGLPRITLHGLRHTHITHLLRDGVTIKAVSARAGHASVSTKLDTYGHLIDNMEGSAADAVESWFTGASQD